MPAVAGRFRCTNLSLPWILASVDRCHHRTSRRGGRHLDLDEREQAIQERIERAEKAVSFLMQLGVSLVLPLWGLAMLVLGVEWRSGWWLGCGVAVGAIGLLMLAGSPLSTPFFRQR